MLCNIYGLRLVNGMVRQAGRFVNGRFVNGRLVKHPSNKKLNVRHCETY